MRSIVCALGLFLAFFVVYSARGQSGSAEYHYKDKLILANNHKLVGQLTYYGSDTIKLELLSGQEILFLKSQIRKIIQYSESEGYLLPKKERVSLLDHPEHKHFFYGSAGLASGKSNSNYFILGSELHLGYKYKINKYHVLTSTIGIDQYGRTDQVVYFPVLLGYEYYFDRLSRSKPYAGLRMGYSMAKATERSSFDFIRGGYHWSPVIGVLFHTRHNLAFFIESGYKFQRSAYAFTNWGTNNDVSILYKRFLFRFGVFF